MKTKHWSHTKVLSMKTRRIFPNNLIILSFFWIAQSYSRSCLNKTKREHIGFPTKESLKLACSGFLTVKVLVSLFGGDLDNQLPLLWIILQTSDVFLQVSSKYSAVESGCYQISGIKTE